MKKKILPMLGMLLFALASGAGVSDLTLDAHIAQGHMIYRQYCASCHGLKDEGDGPMARVLTTPPANLRLLSERYGNPLPRETIARIIDGRVAVKAHGPRDMPVWGKRFMLTRKETKPRSKQ
ncbi:MAG: c-type cytochrome [Candidatus Binataceae bacterium]